MHTVESTGPGVAVGSYDDNGNPGVLWNFPFVIDGQAGIVTVGAPEGVDPNDSLDSLIDYFESDPDPFGSDDSLGFGGIAENDNQDDSPTGGQDDDDDDGAAVAGNGGGEVGDSV